MSFSIQGKVALITGASRGIGQACAQVFRERGAELALTARKISVPGTLSIPADLRDPVQRRHIVSETLAAHGRIDLLINNAGVGLYRPAWDSSPALVREMFEVNFFAALDMIQLVVPHMSKQGSGAIVNVGSIAGEVTLPWMTLYSASKAALASLTAGLRSELRPQGIHVMLVCPGYVATGFGQRALDGEPPPGLRRSRPLSATPRECAEAIARGLKENARTVMVPRTNWLVAGLHRVAPVLVERRLERMNR